MPLNPAPSLRGHFGVRIVRHGFDRTTSYNSPLGDQLFLRSPPSDHLTCQAHGTAVNKL